MSAVRVGIVGVGRWGRNYAGTLTRLPGCRVVALADRDTSKRYLLHHRYGLPVYTSLAAMQESCGLDAVVVATPSDTHFDIAREAVQLGLDVLVEKPMTLSADNARRLAAEAQRANAVLAIGHTALYHPHFQQFCGAVRSNAVALPLSVEAIRTATRRYAGPRDALWDLAAHDLAVVIAALGEPARADAEPTGDDSARYVLDYGAECTCRGRVAGSAAEVTRELHLTSSQASYTWQESPILSPDLEQQPLARQCTDFIRCCVSRQTPLSDGALGIRVTCWLEVLVGALRGAGVAREQDAEVVAR